MIAAQSGIEQYRWIVPQSSEVFLDDYATMVKWLVAWSIDEVRHRSFR